MSLIEGNKLFSSERRTTYDTVDPDAAVEGELPLQAPEAIELQGRLEEIRVLKAELELCRNDARLNTAQAARAIAREIERAAMFETLAAKANARAASVNSRVEQAEAARAAIEQHLHAITNSTAWRLTSPLRRFGTRHPYIARRLRQVLKLVWWSLKLKLFANLREVSRRRKEAAAAQAAAVAAKLRAPAALLPSAGIFEGAADSIDLEEWPVDRPLVSIVIPCFNYGHLVAEAIESVEMQTLKDVEIIVVEGGSSSIASRQQFAELAERVSSRVRILLQDKPHRAGANRNFGISHARGKYICCLDADDRLMPTYVEKAVFLLEHYGYDVVSTGLQFFGERSDRWIPLEHPNVDVLMESNQVLTCAVYRRRLWHEAGGYRDSDPATGHVHEDWLFWTRLAALGARYINITGEPLLLYRSHGVTLSNSDSVLDMETQRAAVLAFNADVLTPEAIHKARHRAETAYREPRPLRNLARRHIPDGRAPILLLAVPFLVLGGAERLLSAIVTHLSRCGWRVIIVSSIPTNEANGETTSWFAEATDEIYHLPRFLSPERWHDFVDYLFATRNIQLLWIVGSAFFYDRLPALKMSYPNLRVVDLLFNTVGHTGNNRRYAKLIDLNLVENNEVREWLLAAGETADKIKVIESGVDLMVNAPGPKDASLFAKHDVVPGTVVVGFSGRWSSEKDPLGFVEIAKRVPAHMPVTFMMTGTGPLEAALRQAIDDAHFAPGRFVMCGSVPDVGPYLRLYDMLVLPSRLDGRPNVVMEALANGCPVLASRVGALPDMLEEGCSGFLFEPGDYDGFAKSIMELCSAPQRLADLKREARSFAERRLDVRRMLETYEYTLRERLLISGACSTWDGGRVS